MSLNPIEWPPYRNDVSRCAAWLATPLCSCGFTLVQIVLMYYISFSSAGANSCASSVRSVSRPPHVFCRLQKTQIFPGNWEPGTERRSVSQRDLILFRWLFLKKPAWFRLPNKAWSKEILIQRHFEVSFWNRWRFRCFNSTKDLNLPPMAQKRRRRKLPDCFDIR